MSNKQRQSPKQPIDPVRIPPQAGDVEMAVLGAMMLEKNAVTRAVEILDESDFYKPAHSQIFNAIARLFENGKPIDLLTLTEELRKQGKLEEVGGEYYLTELTTKVTTAANVDYHAHIVLEKSLMRQLITTSSEMASRAYSVTEDALDLLDEAEHRIFRIADRTMRGSYSSADKLFERAFANVKAIKEKGHSITGISSGYAMLDEYTAGFQKSDMIIIAGRPSTGKTALALSIMKNVSIEDKIPTGMFSLEMAEQQLAFRMLAAQARVDGHNMRRGKLSDDDMNKLAYAISKLSAAKIYVDDIANLTARELRAKARRMKSDHNIGMLVVDYLQLMSGDRRNREESRESEISRISRSIKAIARELEIPILALCQLNRAVEARSDKRPILSDLRESGAIEQDADVVLFVHRPELYDISTMSDKVTPSVGMAEIIIAKQRNGPVGSFYMTFVKKYARFEAHTAVQPESATEPVITDDLPF